MKSIIRYILFGIILCCLIFVAYKTTKETRRLYEPPDYVSEHIRTNFSNQAARFLHKEVPYEHCPTYEVFSNNNTFFLIQLSKSSTEDELIPCAVKVTVPDTLSSFLVYDSRKHPPSIFFYEPNSKFPLQFQDFYVCPKCGNKTFFVAVSFEVPDDSQTPNDTTWFYMSIACTKCKFTEIVYEDETG